MPVGTWTSSSVYQGHLYRTTGSPWVAHDYDPTQLHVFDAGTFALHFNGDTAQFDYSVLDGNGATIGTGSIPIVKEPF